MKNSFYFTLFPQPPKSCSLSVFSLIECLLCYSGNLEATALSSSPAVTLLAVPVDFVSQISPDSPTSLSLLCLLRRGLLPSVWPWTYPLSTLHPGWSFPMQVWSFPSGWKPGSGLHCCWFWWRPKPFIQPRKAYVIWSHLLFESLLTPATRLYGFGGMYHEFIMLHNLQCLSFAPSIPLTLTLLTHVPSSPKDLTVDPHPFISSPLLCIQSPKLFCGWPLPVGAAKVVCFPLWSSHQNILVGN